MNFMFATIVVNEYKDNVCHNSIEMDKLGFVLVKKYVKNDTNEPF